MYLFHITLCLAGIWWAVGIHV